MRLHHFPFSPAALLIAFSTAVTLSAGSITQTTYSGVVSSVTGDTSPFGPGGITSGTPYVLVYTVNDNAVGAVQSSTATSTRIEGPYVVGAALTINGITLTINGSYSSSAENNNAQMISGVPTDRTSNESREYLFIPGVSYHDAYAQSYLSSHASDFLPNSDYHTPVSYSWQGDDSYYNYVYFADFDYVTNQQVRSLYLNLGPGGGSSPSVVTADASGVPEPGSAALVLTGVGLVAGILRLRRN